MSLSHTVLWWVAACVFCCTAMLTSSRLMLFSQLGLHGAYVSSSSLFWQAEKSLRQVEHRLAQQGFAVACDGLFACGISVYHQSTCATQYRIKVCAASSRGKQCLECIYKVAKEVPGCSAPIKAQRVHWTRVFD
jgi:hypothetical protein